LQELLKSTATQAQAAQVQKLLDPLCLVIVSINAESRVKAARGPAPAILARDHETVVLIRVNNDAGVTHALAIRGPQLRSPGHQGDERWLEAVVLPNRAGNTKLGGLKVEYVAVRLKAHDAGKREATLTFDVGQGTQDLGFRAEVPILFTVRAIPAVKECRSLQKRIFTGLR
jgi:hypothetical protein